MVQYSLILFRDNENEKSILSSPSIFHFHSALDLNALDRLRDESKTAGRCTRMTITEELEIASYPGELETFLTTRTGLQLFLRPVRSSDGPLIKELMHALSDESLYARFFTRHREVPYQQIPELVAIDYSRAMAIAAVILGNGAPREQFAGVGRYYINARKNTAWISLAVRDDRQNQGIGQALLSYLAFLARRQGLLGFTAAVLAGNEQILHVLEQGGFEIRKQTLEGIVMLNMMFRKPGDPLSFSP